MTSTSNPQSQAAYGGDVIQLDTGTSGTVVSNNFNCTVSGGLARYKYVTFNSSSTGSYTVTIEYPGDIFNFLSGSIGPDKWIEIDADNTNNSARHISIAGGNGTTTTGREIAFDNDQNSIQIDFNQSGYVNSSSSSPFGTYYGADEGTQYRVLKDATTQVGTTAASGGAFIGITGTERPNTNSSAYYRVECKLPGDSTWVSAVALGVDSTSLPNDFYYRRFDRNIDVGVTQSGSNVKNGSVSTTTDVSVALTNTGYSTVEYRVIWKTGSVVGSTDAAGGTTIALSAPSELPAEGATETYTTQARIDNVGEWHSIHEGSTSNATFTLTSLQSVDTSITVDTNYPSGGWTYDSGAPRYVRTITTSENTSGGYALRISGTSANTIYFLQTSSGTTGVAYTSPSGTTVARSFDTAEPRNFETTNTSTPLVSTSYPSLGNWDIYYIWALWRDDSGYGGDGKYYYTGTSVYVENADLALSAGPASQTIYLNTSRPLSTTYFEDGTYNTQYRIINGNTGRWCDTQNILGSTGVSSPQYFDLATPDSNSTTDAQELAELPGSNQTYYYYLQGRVAGGAWSTSSQGWRTCTTGTTNNLLYIYRSPTNSITGPNAFSFTDLTNQQVKTYVYTTITLSGVSGGNVTATPSGELEISTTNSNYGTTALSVGNQAIYCRMETSQYVNTTVTGTLSVTGGTARSDTWSVTTTTSGGSGGSTVTSPGTTDYGVEVYSTNGLKAIISPEKRTLFHLWNGYVNLTSSSPTSTIGSITNASSSARVGVILDGDLAEQCYFTRATSSITFSIRSGYSSAAGYAIIVGYG